ncbi:MAG: hypothetical protein AAGG07_08730 [Planctomycetota bacterium]
MVFATDRDLLAHDPEVFHRVVWAGQRLASGTATLSGTVVTFETVDVPLDVSGVGAGAVVLVGGTPYEVLDRTGATELSVSKLRGRVTDAPIPGGELSTAVPAQVATFAPQTALVHAQLLRMLGIDSSSEGEVVDPASLAEVEALGTLHLVWSGASALSGPESPAGKRAEWFRKRYAAARREAVVPLDRDGDGEADATRRLNVLHVARF